MDGGVGASEHLHAPDIILMVRLQPADVVD